MTRREIELEKQTIALKKKLLDCKQKMFDLSFQLEAQNKKLGRALNSNKALVSEVDLLKAHLKGFTQDTNRLQHKLGDIDYQVGYYK